MNSLSACLVLSLIGVGCAQTKIPACNSIKPTPVDFSKLIQYSPFNVYQTNSKLFNCAKVVYTGTDSSKSNYTGSSLIIQGPKVFSYDITLIRNSIVNALDCSTNVLANYTAVYSNLVSANQASWCHIECAANGVDYADLVCEGKTQSDFQNIANFLQKNGLTNVPSLYNGQASCSKPKACEVFLN